MHVIDIVLGAFILFSLVRGFLKGLFVEVASLVSLVAGLYGAIHFSNYAASFLENKTDWSPETISISAFALTFLIIILAITLAGKALTKLANFAALGIFNKILGALFGGLKAVLILSVFLIIFNKMNTTVSFVNDENLQDSILYKPIKSIAPMLFPNIITTT